MKEKSLLLVALAVAALVTSCKQSNPADNPPATSGTNSTTSLTNAWQKTREITTNAWADAKDTATNAWANTKTAAMEAWVDIKEKTGSTGDYTYAKKDEFVTQATADVNALDQKIRELSDQAAKANESAKDDARTKLQDVHNKREALDQKLNNVKTATEADWNNAKAAFRNSDEEVQNSIKQTWQWLSDKVSS